MKREAKIPIIIKALCEAKWEWQPAYCKHLALKLKPEDTDEVPFRWTYEFADDVDLTVYFDDEDDNKVDWIELTTKVHFDPENLSAKKYEQLIKNFTSEFEATANIIEGNLGKPVFRGGFKDRGRRKDHEGVVQAYWKIKNAVLIAVLKHEDREVPIRNVVVVAPK
jgi:hypothetical protein